MGEDEAGLTRQVLRDLRDDMRDLRNAYVGISDRLAEDYVRADRLAEINAAWTRALDAEVLRWEKTAHDSEAAFRRQIAQVQSQVDRISAWGVWIGRTVGGVLILALLAVLAKIGQTPP